MVLDAFLKTNVPTSRPRILLSDNGREFKNVLMESYCKSMGIAHHFCIPYRPQSDGTVERFNGSLVGMLRCYGDESGGNWEKFLQKVVDAYNSMVHPTIGTAPYTAMYKLEATSEDFTMPSMRDVVAPTEFDQLREWIRWHVKRVQSRSDSAHNASRAVKRVHSIGDLVWLRDFGMLKRKTGGAGKLARQWCGPWTVTQTWGGVVLTVKRVGGMETKLAHADQVKPFHVSGSTPRIGRRRTEPKRPSAQQQARFSSATGMESDSEVDETRDSTDGDLGEQEFEVETVIGHFRTPKGFWFLVKWAGFVEPTWEHESMLNAPKLVTQYFKSVCESDT
jgi:transposase InsO family protein